MKSPDHIYLELAIETLTTQCESMINKWFSKECKFRGPLTATVR